MAESPESFKDAPLSDVRQRSLADAHLDINIGNTYRLEFIRHLISIATGVFVLSVTFMKDFANRPTTGVKVTLLLGWCCLIASIFSGILHMRYWASYYISWGTNWKDKPARTFRGSINTKRKIAEWIQIYGFVLGLVLLLIFAGLNL